MNNAELLYFAELSHAVYTQGLEYGNDRILYKIKNNTLCIAFAGTDDFNDWLENLYLIPKGIWHRGFYRSFDALILSVENIISTYKDRFNKIIFTGHSKGGATAHIFAQKYKATAISFNAPKCVFKFVSRPSIDGIRVYMENDLIAELPKLTYQHPKIKSLKLEFNGNPIDAHRIENIINILELELQEHKN